MRTAANRDVGSRESRMRYVWIVLALTMAQMSSAHGVEAGAYDLIRSPYALQLLRCSSNKPIEGGWTVVCDRLAGTEPAPEKLQLTHYGPGPKGTQRWSCLDRSG